MRVCQTIFGLLIAFLSFSAFAQVETQVCVQTACSDADYGKMATQMPEDALTNLIEAKVKRSDRLTSEIEVLNKVMDRPNVNINDDSTSSHSLLDKMFYDVKFMGDRIHTIWKDSAIKVGFYQSDVIYEAKVRSWPEQQREATLDEHSTELAGILGDLNILSSVYHARHIREIPR